MQKATFEIRGVKPLLDAIQGIEKGQAKVITRALNTTAKGARTDAVTLIRQELNLKAKSVREGLSIKRATWSNQEAVLEAHGKHGIPLINYAPRPSSPTQRKPKAGVSVQIKARGPRKVIKGAFIAKMKSNHVSVFKRVRGAKRLPIKQLSGVGFIGYLKRGAMQRRLRRRIDERLQKNLLHEINWLIRSNMQKIGKLS